jgi:hypothetical protein
MDERIRIVWPKGRDGKKCFGIVFEVRVIGTLLCVQLCIYNQLSTSAALIIRIWLIAVRGISRK